MRTLILNGSPRRNGDTVALVTVLKQHLLGEIIELRAHDGTIRPCNDCRSCWKRRGCVIQDDMNTLYADDFDTVVIASPVYISTLPGPMMHIASRFQAYYAARRFLKSPFSIRKKQAVLLLVGGGDGSPDPAIDLAKAMFRFMKAELAPENIVLSLSTNTLPANEDQNALRVVREIAQRLNTKETLSCRGD